MHKRQLLFLLILGVAFAAVGYGQVARKRALQPNAADTFTVAVLSDTEWYMEDPQWYRFAQAQAQWIVQNAATQQIKMVLHQGDVVHNSQKPAQWRSAVGIINLIDTAGIPFLIATGEDDSDPAGGYTQFNTYLGMRRYNSKPWFGGSFEPGKAENVYGIITEKGEQFLFLIMENTPRPEVLRWADAVLNEHKQAQAVIVTHTYLADAGKRIVKGASTISDLDVESDEADGPDIWSMIRQHSNVRLVLCGHTSFTEAAHKLVTASRRKDKGAHHNVIHQVMSNYQGLRNGGDSYLRLLTFNPAKHTITVQTYAPFYNKFDQSSDQQFVLKY